MNEDGPDSDDVGRLKHTEDGIAQERRPEPLSLKGLGPVQLLDRPNTVVTKPAQAVFGHFFFGLNASLTCFSMLL